MPTRPVPTPPAKRQAPSQPPAREESVALRLAIGRDGIGLELARPVTLECLRVTEFSTALPGLRFPVDVSGGVPRFRHRRGELRRLDVEVPARVLQRWVAPKLRGTVGDRSPEVWIGVRHAGAVVCIAAPSEAGRDDADVPVIAFDVHALVQGEDLLLVLAAVRGSELPAPATAIAIACVEAALGGAAERRGAAFVIERAASRMARELMPQAGARAPATNDVRWASIAASGDSWLLLAAHGAIPAAPCEAALRAREVAALLREADDARVRGDYDRARSLDLAALERAPRHPEIARRIAEIDAYAGGRAEAALATLADALEHSPFGTLHGELLADIGDVDAAIASLERAGETDPAPAIGARAFERAARLSRDPDFALRSLDRAVARAPRSARLRWSRIERRLSVGRLEDALADVEHLEAAARGSRGKHAVWLRAGTAWRAAGMASRATAIFERALRFAPDDPRALAGLGAALVALDAPGIAGDERRATRGVSVLARAVERAQDQGEPAWAVLVDLSRALAEALGDLPAAVARASSVPNEAPEAPVARGLEGRWRAQLGDLAGAALAFARLRDLAASAQDASDDAIALLAEAAAFERDRRGDDTAAQRHLAVAVRLRPHDERLKREYRNAGEAVARRDRPEVAEPPIETALPPPFPARQAAVDFSVEEPSEDPAAAARVEDLTRALQANPRDEAVADELATLLESLGRGMELLALWSARLEEAPPERRPPLAERARAAMQRLADAADLAGKKDDAALFRDASTMW